MRSNYIHNCGGENQIVKVLPNSTIYVNQKCELISNICTEVKPFSKASVRFQQSVIVDNNLLFLTGSFENPKEQSCYPEHKSPSL